MTTSHDNPNGGTAGGRPDVDLAAYVLGQADPSEARRIERLLRDDAALAAECDQVRTLLTSVRETPSIPVPERLTRRARAAFASYRESLGAEAHPRLAWREIPAYVFGYVRFRFRESAGFRALTLATTAHAALFLLIAGITIARHQQERPHPPIVFDDLASNEAGSGGMSVIESILPKELETPAPGRPELREVELPSDVDLDELPDDVLDDPGRLWREVASNENRLRIGRWVLFARHSGDRRARLVERYGGSDKTEQAAAAGLDWLTRQQSPDGSWNVENLGGDAHYTSGATGLALLAYLGGGHSLTQGTHRDAVSRAVQYLVDSQAPSGRFGSVRETGRTYLYNHAIATQALIECYVMSPRATELREPIDRALRLLARSQNEDGGWRYLRSTNLYDASDSSVTGWVLKTLGMARDAGFLDSGSATIDAARDFLDGLTQENGSVRYTATGVAPPNDSLARTAAACLALDLSALPRDSDPDESRARRDAVVQAMQSSRDWLSDRVSLFVLTSAAFQVGGAPWRDWNERTADTLVAAQAADGSFAPGRLYAANGGAVVSTALAVLTLEVYYRYPRIERD